MKSPSILVLLVVALLCQGALCAATPSPEIQKVLKERYDGKYDLNLKGLVKSDAAKEQLNRLNDKSSYEVYHVPYPMGTADYFSYSIYRIKATGEIWILKSGGVAGVSEVYIVSKPNKPAP